MMTNPLHAGAGMPAGAKPQPSTLLVDALSKHLQSASANASEGLAEVLNLLVDIQRADDVDGIIHGILNRALKITRGDRGDFALLDEASGRLRIVDTVGENLPTAASIGHVAPPSGFIQHVWQLREEDHFASNNLKLGRNYHRAHPKTRSEAAVRIYNDGRPVGVINIESFHRDTFTEERVNRLRVLAHYAGLAIHVVGKSAGLREIVGSLVKADFKDSDNLREVLETIRSLHRIPEGIIYTADYRSQRLRCAVALMKKGLQFTPETFSFTFSERSFAGKVFKTGKRQFSADPVHDRWVSRKGLKTFKIEGPLLGIPLMVGEQRLGVMVLWGRGASQPHRRDFDRLLPIARVAAANLALRQTFRDKEGALSVVHHLLAELDVSLPSDQYLRLILHAVQAIGFDRARYFAYDESASVFRCTASLSVGQKDTLLGYTIRTDRPGYAKHIVDHFRFWKAAHLYDPKEIGGLGPDPDARRLGKPKDLPWIVAPIVVNGRLAGQIAADNAASRRPIGNQETELISLLGLLASHALSLASGFDRELIDKLPIRYIRKDTQGRFVEVNTAFCNDFDLPREELLKRGDKLFPKKLAAKYRKDDAQVLRTGEVLEEVERNVSRAGDRTVTVLKAPAYGPGGKIVGIHVLYHDEVYRSIFDNAIEGIYKRYPNGRYKAVNPALADLLGYDADELTEGDSTLSRDIFRYPRDLQQFQQEMDQKGFVREMEYQARRKDGSFVWVSENARAVRNRRNEVVYHEGFILDRTEYRRRLALLAEAERQQLSHVIAWEIAHELNNPLFSTHGNIEALTLEHKLADPRQIQKHVADALGGIAKMNGMLNRYMSEPTTRWDRRRTRLKALDHDAFSYIDTPATQQGVTVRRPESVPTIVIACDRQALLQVMSNLMKNSLASMPEGGEITLAYRFVPRKKPRAGKPSEPSFLEVTVQDTGAGMSARKLRRLFEWPPSQNGAGFRRHGMGLKVIQKIIQAHGGEVVVTSEPGVGTRVVFWLPARKVR